jgi:hypothetical protein
VLIWLTLETTLQKIDIFCKFVELFFCMPLVIEKLVSGGISFSSDFSSPLAACSRAQPLAPDREFEEAFLPVSQFFGSPKHVVL